MNYVEVSSAAKGLVCEQGLVKCWLGIWHFWSQGHCQE